jgi:hypothetical protein
LTPRRRLIAAVSAGVAVASLTGCERPAPIVTVVSGTNSEWKEADLFCFEGQAFEAGDCAQRAEGPIELPVAPGQQVGVDVSKAVVERGWFIELSASEGGGEAQQSEVFEDEHYFAFTAPQLGEQGLRLTIRSLGEQGEGGPPSGEWTFDLVPKG